jgi:hypothetical protein
VALTNIFASAASSIFFIPLISQQQDKKLCHCGRYLFIALAVLTVDGELRADAGNPQVL